MPNPRSDSLGWIVTWVLCAWRGISGLYEMYCYRMRREGIKQIASQHFDLRRTKMIWAIWIGEEEKGKQKIFSPMFGVSMALKLETKSEQRVCPFGS